MSIETILLKGAIGLFVGIFLGLLIDIWTGRLVVRLFRIKATQKFVLRILGEVGQVIAFMVTICTLFATFKFF